MSNQENNSKETKKTRRKRSKRTAQQIKLAVIMIMVSVLVLSASTFAWYKLNNTANLQNMQFTADTLGNLQIAPAVFKSDGVTVEPGTFVTSLDLELNKDANKKTLLPATTTNGKIFYSPVYDKTGEVVTGVSDAALVETESSFDKYVYKKEFYIKSGESETDKWYTLKLANGVVDDRGAFIGGTYITTKTADGTKFTPANAVRVSFVLGDGALINAGNGTYTDATGTIIWEPYDTSTENDVSAGERATNNLDSSYGGYDKVTQAVDGVLNNGTLCTIKEGIPAKITMYVWIEGTDDDCTNEIALDTILGQLQFVAE